MKTKIITIDEAVLFLKNNDNFLILCHVNPDGDTLGSGYALCGALHLMGKHAKVICDDEPSPRFDYLLGAINSDLTDFKTEDAVIITVDVADPELLGSLKDKYKAELCIDHHISNKKYAEQTLLDTEASSCAEVVWGLVKALDVKITPQIAEAVYTGISTDTGCFRYSNTTANAHAIAAQLIGLGVDTAKINYLMFEMKTRQRIKLEQQAFSAMEYYFNDRCAVVALTADMLEGVDPEDAGNVSILPKQIEGVEVGVIMKEKPSESDSCPSQTIWKVSVRTNTEINAQSICNSLGGGGHIRAAGCTLKGTLDSVKQTVLREIESQII